MVTVEIVDDDTHEIDIDGTYTDLLDAVGLGPTRPRS